MYVFFWSNIFSAKSIPQKIENMQRRLFKKVWKLAFVYSFDDIAEFDFLPTFIFNPFTPNRDLIQYLKEIFLVLLLPWLSSNWFQILIKRQKTTDALGLSVTRY